MQRRILHRNNAPVPSQPRGPSDFGSDLSDDARSAGSRASSCGSVDSIFVEQFSRPGEASDPSTRGSRSSASDVEEQHENPNLVRGWVQEVASRVLRSGIKRRARKLLNELIKASAGRDGQAAARERRSQAAMGLVDIIQNEPDGEKIVVGRFLKKVSRQERGIQALLRLSDDELDQFGYDAVSPVSERITFSKVLPVVSKYMNETQLLRTTISTAFGESGKGVAAILHLALMDTQSFCFYVKQLSLHRFFGRIVVSDGTPSPRWYCGAKLFCVLLIWDFSYSYSRRDGQLIFDSLSSVCKMAVRTATAALQAYATIQSEQNSVQARRYLPLIALCCNAIRNNRWWNALPQQSTMDAFMQLLIPFLHLEGGDLQSYNTSQACALSTLLSLFDRAPFTNDIPEISLTSLGTVLLETALKRRIVDTRSTDPMTKNIFKALNSSLDQQCIQGLCRLPEFVFSGALKAAVLNGILQLNSLNVANPYEPLGLVERLLWLSNMKSSADDELDLIHQTMVEGEAGLVAQFRWLSHRKPAADDYEKIYRALVEGEACRFLAHVIVHSGNLDPQDRGLWRAKGLAMTCLGNIIEVMDHEQFHNHITQEMIDAVVGIKEDEDVPELPKGQALLLLKRYTWAANSRGIRPFYNEDTSNLADEFKITGLSNR